MEPGDSIDQSKIPRLQYINARKSELEPEMILFLSFFEHLGLAEADAISS